MRSICSLLLCIVLLSGCEGNRIGEGTVCDSLTKIPLDSVKYGYTDSESFIYTDSTGAYAIDGPFGGCIPECPDYHVTFAKPGYQTKKVKNPNGRILLVRN